MQTFNEISGTLAKISAPSAASVAGPIANLIVVHAQNKERIDSNYQLLGAAWEKVFNGELDQAIFEEQMRWFFRAKVGGNF